MFLTTEQGRRYAHALSKASYLDLGEKLLALAYAAYANSDGEGVESDEVMSLASALHLVCGMGE